MIGFIIDELANGGQERQFMILLSELDKQGKEVSVIVWNWRPSDRYANELLQLNHHLLLFASKEQISFYSKIKAARNFIYTNKLTSLQTYSFPLNWVTALICLGINCSPVSGLRSSFVYYLERNKSVFSKLKIFLNALISKRLIANNFQGAIELTAFAKKWGRKIDFEILSNKLILPEPKQTTEKVSITDPIEFVSMGSLLKIKRWDLLVEILAGLKEAGIQFHHRLAGGNGPLRPVIENLIKQRSLQNEVELVGVIDNLDAFYSNAHFLIHTSSSEGTPNVVLEALAHGIPVICSNCGDVGRYITQNENGLIITKDEPKFWVDHILQFLKEGQYQRLAKNARATAQEKLDVNQLVEEFNICYDKLNLESI